MTISKTYSILLMLLLHVASGICSPHRNQWPGSGAVTVLQQLCGFSYKLRFAAAYPRAWCALFGKIILHKAVGVGGLCWHNFEHNK